MPLTKSGRKVLSSMKETYGPKKAKKVFYASVNKDKKGSKKWHKKPSGVQSQADGIEAA